MDRAAEVKVPTAALAPLLDEHGIEVTWRALLKELAQRSYAHGRECGVLDAPEYTRELPAVPNLLAQLSIGQIGIMYEFSLAHVDRSARKSAGQYFTPDDVAQFLAERTATFEPGVWLDPASGIGNLSYWLAARQADPEAFVREQLYLLDRDPLALAIARTLFSLLFYRSQPDLYAALAPRFVVGDFLSVTVPAHDYALLNPPYAARLADERFESVAARDWYAYFLERVAKTSRGFVSVTPQSFTNSGKFAGLRTVLAREFNHLRVWVFDNIPDAIFSGVKFGSENTNTSNSTRAAVIVAKRQAKVDHQITSILRWPVARRAELLARADEFLGPVSFTAEKFPKELVPTRGLLAEVAGWAQLRALTVPDGEFTLTVPASPRYYISATVRELSRSSFHTLRFATAAERDRAYLLVNSGLTYWWWRLMDGGMTLSQETLFSTPVPPQLTAAPELVALLRASEVANLTAKANAGKLNENVKHPPALRLQLDTALFGAARATQFQSIATNDDLSYLPRSGAR